MIDESHEEDWAIYFTRINEGQFCSILVDLGLIDFAPDESRPFLITIATHMNDPAEDGLSTESENDTLNQIEECFIESIVAGGDALYAGRAKFAGKIQSYFYSGNGSTVETAVSELKTLYPVYRFEHTVEEDPKWETYIDILYPSAVEMQNIQNDRVIANLEENGDKLEKERAVDHWIYFDSEADREKFLEAIKGQGFKTVGKDLNDENDMPYELQLSRIDKVDHQSVSEHVLYLWEKAQEFNGDYDGWETFVNRD